MTEVSFAKSFLTTLDSCPNKLSADHLEDPKGLSARNAYILPKYPRHLSKKLKITPGAEASIKIYLKSLRNPVIDLYWPENPISTSILDLKERLSKDMNIPLDKIKLLWNKKPVGDSKVLKDLLAEGDIKAEFGVMVLGGAASIRKQGIDVDKAEPVVGSAEVKEGNEISRSDQFWGDLRGFLVQRLKDEGEGERFWRMFKKAYDAEN